ncbi:hypothetical protein F5J12DRAFT_837097 [Pisolithus orientalis]|uniref:uncharacterized protein n=1 Tax=Pisolithus orientalis TaxID=936130 RepID=UPI0022250BA8|nr:uncharacterized protein F5J12DRAFT_837097 [Pisolithus orientalis]KAI6004459.1 hypothetical protein F5J12DRAFT_837097 [Pisolithus orientalis]
MTVPSTNIEYMWAVVGGPKAGIYRDPDCPRMKCGKSSPPLPIAIQCISQQEAQLVCRTLQPIMNALPADLTSRELLTALRGSPDVRSLLHDNEGFHAVVVGAPPGVHRTKKSVIRAEGTFRCPKTRYTASFWEALAFIVVKGIEMDMPPLSEPTETHNGVGGGVAAIADGTLRFPAGPIIYTHIRSLRALRSRSRAQPLGGIVAQYLAAHGYGLSDVDIILNCYRKSSSVEPFAGEQFVMHLAREGLPVAEGNFLLAMIRRQR